MYFASPMKVLMVGSLLGLVMAPLVVQSGEEDIIKYRRNVMKAVAGHMGAAGAIVQGKVGYKGDLANHAGALQALMHDIPGLFPKDSDFGETNALDAVWSKRAEFEKRAKDAGSKAAAFAKVAQGGSAGAAFKALGDTCKGCHKDFRRKED
jgi:cytochrome c556